MDRAVRFVTSFTKGLRYVVFGVAVLAALFSVLSFVVFVVVVVFVSVFPYRAPQLDYMFEDDDATANFAVTFPLEELTLRLDSSGHQHGSPWYGSESDLETIEASLDNQCTRAWFRPHYVNAKPVLHVVGIEANDECKPGSSRESLLTLFQQTFVPRLEGTLSPLSAPAAGPGFYEYPVGASPSFLITGSIEDARVRLDGDPSLYHAAHDGVFYLDEVACSWRFRLADETQSNAVLIVGLGYVKPCRWGSSDVCVARVFTDLLQYAGDPTSTPTATVAQASTPTPCPKPDFGRRR
jgi:hypothetical protein